MFLATEYGGKESFGRHYTPALPVAGIYLDPKLELIQHCSC
jgi:hypothetical protein